MPTNIGTQLADAVETLHLAPDLADRIIQRSRLRRRRQLAGITFLAVAGIAAAVTVPIATSSDSSSVSRLVPAASLPPVLASVNGVDVTWLPSGFRALPYSPTNGGFPGLNDGVVVLRGFQGKTASGVIGTLSLAVQRGPVLNIDTFGKGQVVTGRFSWTPPMVSGSSCGSKGAV